MKCFREERAEVGGPDGRLIAFIPVRDGEWLGLSGRGAGGRSDLILDVVLKIEPAGLASESMAEGYKKKRMEEDLNFWREQVSEWWFYLLR